MRKFIDIIRETYDDDEDDAPEEVVDPFVAEVQSTLHHHGSDGEADEIEYTRRLLAKRTAASPLLVYRFMRLDPDRVAALQGGEGLGQHWTTDRKMPTDNLYDEGDGTMFMFAAHANAADIAEAYTVAFNILFPDEDEVFLLPRARVTLQGIFAEGSQENVRPDLKGTVFGVRR